MQSTQRLQLIGQGWEFSLCNHWAAETTYISEVTGIVHNDEPSVSQKEVTSVSVDNMPLSQFKKTQEN